MEGSILVRVYSGDEGFIGLGLITRTSGIENNI